jgi:hypothetical protein
MNIILSGMVRFLSLVGLSIQLTNLYAGRSVRYNMSTLPPIPPDISRA